MTKELCSGAGGQHRNKTDSAVRCTHIASGAVGKCEESRSQHKNKAVAFGRMAKTAKFKPWYRIEVTKRMGHYVDIDRVVDEMMTQITVEVKNKGRLVKV